MTISVRTVTATLAATGILAVAAVVTVLLAADDETPSETNTPKAPAREEFMRRYAEINPGDPGVTPEQFDSSAKLICNTLRQGHTVDETIEIYAWNWTTNTAEIVRLHVAYGCPDYLRGFK